MSAKGVRALIFRMVSENPTWRVPRIHGELLKLGFDVSERSVSQRTHLGLAKDTPASRPAELRSARENEIQSFPRLGGLHHRYVVAA